MTAWHPKTSFRRLGGIGWTLGLMTGKSRGVSTVALLVFSFPILPSKSFSLISKLKLNPHKKQRSLIKSISFPPTRVCGYRCRFNVILDNEVCSISFF
jgi:hypothetical protein